MAALTGQVGQVGVVGQVALVGSACGHAEPRTSDSEARHQRQFAPGAGPRRQWRLLARWRSDSGAELIEFALAFPLLLLVVMGILDFGLMFQQYEVITNAAREGARVAVLPEYTDDDVRTRVDQYLSAGLLSAGSGPAAPATITRQNVVIGTNCMTTVTVAVAYPHNYWFLSGIMNFFSLYFGTGTLTSKTLNAASTMRTEVVAGACS